MKCHELVEHAHDAPTGERRADGDLQGFVVAFIDHGQQTNAASVVQRVGHEIESPGLIQDRRCHERLPNAPGNAPRRPPRQIRPQGAQTVNPLVVPRLSLDPSSVKKLPPPAWIARHGVRQRRDHCGISPARRQRRLVVRRARAPHHTTGSLN